MEAILKNIIEEENVALPKVSELERITNIPHNTISNALRRPVGKTSFEVVAKILMAAKVSIDKVAKETLETKELTPAQEEQAFMEQTDLKGLTIMGIKFSTQENYWKTRDSILNSIYEGHHPTIKDVKDAYKQLEDHVSVDQVVADIISEYQD